MDALQPSGNPEGRTDWCVLSTLANDICLVGLCGIASVSGHISRKWRAECTLPVHGEPVLITSMYLAATPKYASVSGRAHLKIAMVWRESSCAYWYQCQHRCPGEMQWSELGKGTYSSKDLSGARCEHGVPEVLGRDDRGSDIHE